MKQLFVVGVMALVCLLSACTNEVQAPDCNGAFTYSGFDDEGRVHLWNVQRRWLNFTGRELVFIETKTAEPRCHISQDLAPMTLNEKPVVGFHEYPSHNIRVDPNGADLEATLLHELGHAHGLQHREDGVIMHPDLHPGGDFNDADRDECERVGVCYGAKTPAGSPAASPM